MTKPPARRWKAEDRREQLLDVATSLFGESGIAGTTTMAVARHGGVSQPYVIKTFGSKEALLVAIGERMIDRIATTFRTAIATLPPDADDETRNLVLGAAYTELMADRGTLLTMSQFFGLGSHPVLGPQARDGFMSIYRILRHEAGYDAQQAVEFIQVGMLINTLAGTRLVEHLHEDPEIEELLTTAFNAPTDVTIALLAAGPAASGAPG